MKALGKKKKKKKKKKESFEKDCAPFFFFNASDITDVDIVMKQSLPLVLF